MPTSGSVASMSRSPTLLSRGDHVDQFARKHGIPQTHRDHSLLLADPKIDVVDICTPPALHTEMIVAAVNAGKHVPKALMFERVMAEMDRTRAAVTASGKLFMYAEDWVYAPAVAKTVEIVKATKDKIL